MNEEIKQAVELEARRVFSSEAGAYREHLERQFGHLKWAVSIIVALGATVFVYAFGKTYSELSTYAHSQVDERVIDYKVKEDIQKRLKTIVDFEVDGDTTKNRISERISDQVRKSVAANSEGLITEAINRKAQELGLADFTRRISSIPIGTVISSILPPDVFAQVVGDSAPYDPRKSSWILADGRDVSPSRFAQFISEVKAPDLRGVFIRGMNAGRSDGQQDPDQRKVGSFQPDDLKKHNHRSASSGGFVVQSGNRPASLQGFGGSMQLKDTTEDNDGGPETRPRNVAVYFYLKIN